MSIVKDLLLISLFLFIVINYILLNKEFIKQRKYFVDTLSHDLRVSAIAQIRGIELLQKDSGEKNEIIENLHESSKFSLEMINMLLNSYRYKHGDKFLKYENFSPWKLINQACDEFKDKAEQKDINFFYKINKQAKINAEKAGIYKVITTILSTAINNSYNSNLIYIKLDQDSKHLQFSLTYRGKTLSEEECKRMFMENPKFSTVGQGIKLHLAKKIIDFHNGKISVKKTQKYLTTLCFTLPVKKKKLKIDSQLSLCLKPSQL